MERHHVVLTSNIDDAALSNASNTADWLAYGRTYSGDRFGPEDQINTSNVKNLKVDFYVDLPEEPGGIVSTPLVSNGVMYLRTSKDTVYAVNAVTGQRLWTYDPKIGELMNEEGRNPQMFYLHAGCGLSLWQDKLYTATADGRLVALDPRSGKEVWVNQTFDPKSAQYVVGAPIALHGKVILGVAGTEFGRRVDAEKTNFNRGYVTAYDAQTGMEAWRFWIVPGDPGEGIREQGDGDGRQNLAGGLVEVWRRRSCVGRGLHLRSRAESALHRYRKPNPPPRQARGKGDALFTDSIVAVNADTGAYRWHYQLNPSEQWGWDGVTPMITADLKIKGKVVKALMLAPKNGFFYVIDRTNGKLVSAEPYTKVNWASKIDLQTGRPVEMPEADYSTLGKATVWPGASGPRSWEANSFNPKTGLVYIASHDQATLFQSADRNFDSSTIEGFSYYWMLPSGYEAKGTLQGWDPVKQKRVWQVPLSGPIGPGTLTTAGQLIFHGQANGDFVAYDATTGERLWSQNLGLGITAPPITYTIGGRQYVAQLIGYGSSHTGFPEVMKFGWQYRHQMRRLVVFSLKGNATLPPQPPAQLFAALNCPDVADRALAEKGVAHFGQCALCHSGSLAPNLYASPVVCSKEAFNMTVRHGRPALRMPPFKNMSDDEIEALRHYLRAEAANQLSGASRSSDH